MHDPPNNVLLRSEDRLRESKALVPLEVFQYYNRKVQD